MNLADLIYGYQKKVPAKGGNKRYINLDNAASTPPFKAVMELICREAEWYSSVHRGSGFKSKYSTAQYEASRQVIADFIGADLRHDTVIFTKNTTDSINKVAHYLPNIPGEYVIYSGMEHHSNELPWSQVPHICIGVKENGIDLDQLEQALRLESGRVKLLAVTGASNVTGHTPPIHTLAELAHQAGAKILVDGAQLIPHRQINLFPPSDPRHIDFLAFSGHKIYAPFGAGVLIAPRSLFQKNPPSQVGGGTIIGIGPEGIIWAEAPDVEEAGSPNILGAMAIAESCRVIQRIGWDPITRHETELLEYALKCLEELPELEIYNREKQNRVGVISFNIRGIPHAIVAQHLAERGIGVRSGCFCARGYVQSLLGLSAKEIQILLYRVLKGDIGHETMPGMVRLSFGCYNQISEVDILILALKELITDCTKI